MAFLGKIPENNEKIQLFWGTVSHAGDTAVKKIKFLP